jgi:hypothetical protein
VGLPNDGPGDSDKQTPINYDERIVFKFNGRWRIKAGDIQPIQKSLIEWAHKWQLDL